MTLSYWELLLLDFTILVICCGLMLRHGRLTALHPACLYFAFHGYTFTFRLFQLANGAPTLFETWGTKYAPVTQHEIQRASLVAIVTLSIMTMVWLRLASKYQNEKALATEIIKFRPFSEQIMRSVVYVTLPIGLVALVVLRGNQFVGGEAPVPGSWSSSSYLISMYQWFGMSLLALIFYYGPQLRLVLPLLAYLLVALLSFPSRGMVIIPGLLLVFVYLRWNNLKWPSLRLVIAALTMMLIFTAGKELGFLLRTGDIASAGDLINMRMRAMQSGTHGDAMFMDMLAVTMSQTDEQDTFFYGTTYVGLLTLPIPRQFWKEKPGLADWQKEIQTAGRPTGISGMIVTASGEAYANFGYAGIVSYAILLAWLLAKLHASMLRAPYYSLANYWSLCIYSILIQVFRDGMLSFVNFQVSMLTPLTAIAMLHLFLLYRYYKYGWSWRFSLQKHGKLLIAQEPAHHQRTTTEGYSDDILTMGSGRQGAAMFFRPQRLVRLSRIPSSSRYSR